MPTFTSPAVHDLIQDFPADLARRLQECRDTIERLSLLQEQVDLELLELRRDNVEPCGLDRVVNAWPTMCSAAVSVLKWIIQTLVPGEKAPRQ